MEVNVEEIKKEIEICSSIKNIKKDIRYYINIIENLRNKLDKEKLELQIVCSHNYVRDNDGDYHNLRYYDRCEKCDYILNSNRFNT